MRTFIKIMVICLVLFGASVTAYLLSPLPIQGNVDVYIFKGSNVAKAAKSIEQAKLARLPILFKILLRGAVRFGSGAIYSGAYRFNSTHNHLQLLRAILSGKQALKIRVTFPEGIIATKFASILKKNIDIDSAEFMKLIRSDSLMNALGIHAPSLEGYLMPDTYEYYWRQPAEDVVENLVNQQTRIWKEKFESVALGQGKTRTEILTLASIVEAETPQSSERSRVAGVYANRLSKGMRLEADPTVQYAIGGESRRVMLSDLDVESDYNTYRHSGLPPGPINSPSVSSIEAALHPENSKYLFFCAKGDGSNTHSFAVNSAEHQINVARYRKNRRLQQAQ